MTDRDMKPAEVRAAIRDTLGDSADGINVDGIAEAIHEDYGIITSLDDVPQDEYWEIVRAYDGTDL